MTKREPNVKIENNKVILSSLILIALSDLETEENSEYLKKYKELLLDPSNLIAEKYEVHHIIPVFAFKDKIYRNRELTESIADRFDENKIKLSYSNHIIAHYYLWKIFNNWDSKRAIQKLCNELDVENLTEDEIIMIGKFEEECRKKNQTKEERAYVYKKWVNNNQDWLKTYKKGWNEKNKERNKETNKKWISKHKKRYSEYQKSYTHQLCYDHIAQNGCTYETLRWRKRKNKDLYKNIKPSKYIIRPTISFEEFQKLDDLTKESLLHNFIKTLQ